MPARGASTGAAEPRMLNVISWDGEGSESMVAEVIEWPCWRTLESCDLIGGGGRKKEAWGTESIKQTTRHFLSY